MLWYSFEEPRQSASDSQENNLNKLFFLTQKN